MLQIDYLALPNKSSPFGYLCQNILRDLIKLEMSYNILESLEINFFEKNNVVDKILVLEARHFTNMSNKIILKYNITEY